MKTLEKQQSKWLTPEQWAILKKQCIEYEIDLGPDSLDYGSAFISAKTWFILGWDARNET